MTTTIRRATPADAAPLSAFAAEAFRDTFGADNTPSDMTMFLDATFTADRQAAEIADANAVVLLAEDAHAPTGDRLVGYAYLASSEAPASVVGAHPIELRRLYVHRSRHGRGVAQALMAACLDVARERLADTLWLGVWERNPRAAAFYAKHGFARVGEHTFLLGQDAQTDWLLARPVGDA